MHEHTAEGQVEMSELQTIDPAARATSSTEDQGVTCNCKPIMLNGERTGSTEWYHACPEHGVMSEWWNDPARVAERERKSIELRDIQVRAAQARRAARPTT